MNWNNRRKPRVENQTPKYQRGKKTCKNKLTRAHAAKTNNNGKTKSRQQQKQQQHDVLIKNWQCAVLWARRLLWLYIQHFLSPFFARHSISLHMDLCLFLCIVYIAVLLIYFREMRQKRPLCIVLCRYKNAKMFCGQINDMNRFQWQRTRSRRVASSNHSTASIIEPNKQQQQQQTKGALINERDSNTRQKKNME